MRYAIMLTAVFMFSVSSVSAESTAEMLSSCSVFAEAKVRNNEIIFLQNFDSGICWGAFSAIQSLIPRTYANGQHMFYVCAPPTSRRHQLIAIFVEYAKRNPQRLHENFFDVAIDSLQAAFPCQQR